MSDDAAYLTTEQVADPLRRRELAELAHRQARHVVVSGPEIDLEPFGPEEPAVDGEDLPVEELARRAGTIPYELLCGVTQRVGVTFV